MELRKGNFEGQTSQCGLEGKLKRQPKISAVLPTHLEMVLSKMSRILLNKLCTFETGITSQ